MELKELRTTGVMLPEIGLGTHNYNVCPGPLRKGVEAGAFLIDTAEAYGTEEVVGQVAKGQRESVFIATKVSETNLMYDQVITAANNSLSRLGTDYIDLYQVHGPDPSVPMKETMRAMEVLVQEGKVRYIGVSNFTADQMKEAQDVLNRNMIVSNQMRYNLADREIEDSILPYCQENGITVLAYTPLHKGMLSSLSFPFWRTRAMSVLREIASEIGKTPAQVALNWCTSKPNVIAIPKSTREERIMEFCGASGWRLTPEHIELLNRSFVRY